MSGVDAAQAAWEVLGGPGQLADLPSPDQLPDAVVTSSIPVVTGAALQNARATAGYLDTLNTIHLAESTSATLTDASTYLRELADAVDAHQSRGVVEWGIRWAVHEDDLPDYLGGFATREAAQNTLNQVVFTGIIVARKVRTSEWVAS